ncbi:cytochrome o ubiquinol oxidase subunit III [Candidatus Saccharibacteria bacterium]|nr:MAG: cytochrome o ubiquinol oxidase subunit III [Candidatus Saccharibacteria bacterium]
MSHIVEAYERARNERASLGFWIYLMTDCVLFGSLFATYAVLRNNTFGGPSGADIFEMPFVLIETLILLTSSFLCGIAMLAAKAGKQTLTLVLFGATLLLGISFLAMEVTEFSKLIHEGYSWQTSAFLSGFFTLVGTHGAHILAGLIWMVVMIVRAAQVGLTDNNLRRLSLLALFWHFLDVIWIFIFTIVYLMGVAS